MANTHATIVPHGTLDYSEMRALGLRPEDLTLFSSNINPFGPPPAVVDALRSEMTPETVARYPDRLSLELRGLLADYHHVPTDSILVGNGSADLFWLVGLLHLPRRRVAILGPTFGEYRNVAQIMQSEVIDIAHPGWRVDGAVFQPAERSVEQTAEELSTVAPDVVFVCNPNNPTGHHLTLDELERIRRAAPNALWIVDEAYAEFMLPPTSTAAWTQQHEWFVMRSMTKDFALGGLRLGYLIGPSARVKPLQVVQPPWNVNTFAQLGGCVSLREGLTWREETLTKLRTETATLQRNLRALGFEPLPTTVNYFLVPVESPARVRQQLLERRLVVRDCTSFGLPRHIRIATQLPEANARLLDALEEIARA